MNKRSSLVSPLSPPLLTSLALALALLAVPACKKDKHDGDTVNPDEASTTDGGEGEGDTAADVEVDSALPEQEADPAEFAGLYQRFLKGEFAEVATEAQALRATLTADTQIRGNALLAALEGLAAGREIPENGRDVAEEAVAAGVRLGDPEVQQFAHVAHAAYLTGIHESAEAQAELDAVIGNEGAYAVLARLYLAEAHLNQAFGVGEDDGKIVAPERLDQAAVEYKKVIGSGDPLLEGRAHEGLAAVYDYKRDKPTACGHLQEADEFLAEGEAGEMLRDNISHHAGALRCKDFVAAGSK